MGGPSPALQRLHLDALLRHPLLRRGERVVARHRVLRRHGETKAKRGSECQRLRQSDGREPGDLKAMRCKSKAKTQCQDSPETESDKRKGHLRGELLVVDGRLELLLVVLRRQQCLFSTQVHHHKTIQSKTSRRHEVKSESLS